MDPDQTGSTGAILSRSTTFLPKGFKTLQQTTKQTTFVMISALRFKNNVCFIPIDRPEQTKCKTLNQLTRAYLLWLIGFRAGSYKNVGIIYSSEEG